MSLSRRVFLGASGASAAALTLPGCMTTNAATGRRSYTGTYSAQDDVALGRKEHPKLLQAFGGEYNNRRLQSYVSQIGGRLSQHTEYKQFPYQFTLLNSPIVNAFALPGGFVYVSRGLLALGSNEAELAGVLAHELGHVNARHSAERMSAGQLASLGVMAGAIGASLLGLPAQSVAQLGQQVATMSIQSYSRKQEFEADTLGVRYMSRAGYDPEAMVTFLSTLREQSQVEAQSLGLKPGSVDQYNMMSTHPRTIDRVRAATEHARVERVASPRLGRQEYLSRIDGMLFGDDPSQGIVKGNSFVHPGLRFAFSVPEDFRINNSQERIVAQNRTGHTIVFDLAQMRAGDPGRHIRDEWAKGAEVADLERVQVDGSPAATGRARVSGKSGQADVRMLAIQRDTGSAYRFMFIAPVGQTQAIDAMARHTARSFNNLSSAEAAKVKPLRLQVRAASARDTVEGLSRSLPYGRMNPAWFRVLNDLSPREPLKARQPLKVIST
ncbi:MAG: M48 family metalloprotease [Gammaproteobacteria bacterium]|nr:M48 family metalloprotease [Gammaproteobacteria bacterium]